MESRVFVTRVFEKWSRKETIHDDALLDAIRSAESGLIDADLKGCLIKLRIGRPNAGKRSGYRTLVAFHTEFRSFFLYGFPKNERGNITSNEAALFEEYGAMLLKLTDDQVNDLCNEGKLRELRKL